VGGPSVFCVDGSISDGRNGPFMIYNSKDAAALSQGLQIPGSADSQALPLFRCIHSSGTHYFSTEKACGGEGKMESQLGFISQKRGGETLRGLFRCRVGGVAGVFVHALDIGCADGDTADPEVELGFVR